jgi:hypothetical protein
MPVVFCFGTGGTWSETLTAPFAHAQRARVDTQLPRLQPKRLRNRRQPRHHSSEANDARW